MFNIFSAAILALTFSSALSQTVNNDDLFDDAVITNAVDEKDSVGINGSYGRSRGSYQPRSRTDRRGSWNGGRGSWNVGRGSWNGGRGSWNGGRGSWNGGRGSWNGGQRD
eukprot:Pgem_evm1s2987